jgi:hypothetical protein
MAIEVCIFTGPTVSPADVRRELQADLRPPAAQGDVYRAALEKPRAIGIIDGYFERVPAVWHKEILWALQCGVRVYGSASIGALRAAELHAFGMRGVGKIFEAFRDGVLEDDDEVAVTHGLAEQGFPLLSEAMVNIRCTFAAAEAAAVLSPSTRVVLERIAKDLYYPERSYPEILRRGGALGIPEDVLAAVGAWLVDNRIDQKREDALAMLRSIRTELSVAQDPHPASFEFQHTTFWNQAVRSGPVAGPTSGRVQHKGPRTASPNSGDPSSSRRRR